MLSRLKKMFGYVPPDVEAVSNASQLLGIGPFAVFAMAYERWHGEKPATKSLEPVFVRYLFEQTAPPWVRHFTRLITFQAENGRFDRTEYGLPAPPPERMAPSTLDRWNLAVYTVTLCAIFFVVPTISGI